MKKILLAAALFTFTAASTEAQTNRTYKTNMQDERIKKEEKAGGGINQSQETHLNKGSALKQDQSMKAQEPISDKRAAMNETLQENPGMVDTLKYPQYDTSKNNGHFPGGGSGATTDPHETDFYRGKR